MQAKKNRLEKGGFFIEAKRLRAIRFGLSLKDPHGVEIIGSVRRCVNVRKHVALRVSALLTV